MPSTRVILSLVITYAVIILPTPAIFFMRKKIPSENDIIVILGAIICQIVIGIAGVASSFAAAILQVHLIVTRFRNGLGFGNLSVLRTGLQAVSLAALSASQWAKFSLYDLNDGHSKLGPVEWYWVWFKCAGRHLSDMQS
ncbi:hypothetical protein BJX64DRAFT_291540 [Aspergillus heterothallicus]